MNYIPSPVAPGLLPPRPPVYAQLPHTSVVGDNCLNPSQPQQESPLLPDSQHSGSLSGFCGLVKICDDEAFTTLEQGFIGRPREGRQPSQQTGTPGGWEVSLASAGGDPMLPAAHASSHDTGRQAPGEAHREGLISGCVETAAGKGNVA